MKRKSTKKSKRTESLPSARLTHKFMSWEILNSSGLAQTKNLYTSQNYAVIIS